MNLTRQFRFLRLLMRLRRSGPRPRCLVHLEWGPSDLEREMVALDFIPSVGDDIEIEIRNVADDPERWRVTPQTLLGKVTRVQHSVQIDYGNDPGPEEGAGRRGPRGGA